MAHDYAHEQADDIFFTENWDVESDYLELHKAGVPRESYCLKNTLVLTKSHTQKEPNEAKDDSEVVPFQFENVTDLNQSDTINCAKNKLSYIRLIKSANHEGDKPTEHVEESMKELKHVPLSKRGRIWSNVWMDVKKQSSSNILKLLNPHSFKISSSNL